MRITRKQLRRLIESVIREEADGMVPTDTASQVAASEFGKKSKKLHAMLDSNDWDPYDSDLQRAFKGYFRMLFDEVNQGTGGAFEKVKKVVAEKAVRYFLENLAPAFYKSPKSANDWDFLNGEELSPTSKKLAQTMVGMHRAGTGARIGGSEYESLEEVLSGESVGPILDFVIDAISKVR